MAKNYFRFNFEDTSTDGGLFHYADVQFVYDVTGMTCTMESRLGVLWRHQTRQARN